MADFIRNRESTVLGDLVEPYLQGQFTHPDTVTAPIPPSHQEVSINQREEVIPAPFPLSQTAASDMMSPFYSGQRYEIPPAMTHRLGKVGGGRGVLGEQRELDPRYTQLGNAVKVLQGRIRQEPQFQFTPTRTSRPKNEASRGVSSSSMAQRLGMYLNTPVSMAPPNPDYMNEGIMMQPPMIQEEQDSAIS